MEHPAQNPDFEEIDPDIDLANLWADIVTGRDKQDVTVILVAPKGYGKSHSGVSLCYDVARAIAARVGGYWDDYFPYDTENKELKNCACIIQKDIVKLMGLTRPRNVYLLDDVSVGMNSRKFASDTNILINEIFQLMRVDECVTITTTMDQSYVDKVPREIIGWFIEIVEPHHAEGYNIMKVFRNKKMFRSGKLHQVYPTLGNERYTRFVVEAPPPDLAEAYDLLRRRKTREHRKARLEEYLAMIEDTGGIQKVGKREMQLQSDVTKWGDKILKLRLEDGKSDHAISKMIPLSPSKIGRIAAAMGITD